MHFACYHPGDQRIILGAHPKASTFVYVVSVKILRDNIPVFLTGNLTLLWAGIGYRLPPEYILRVVSPDVGNAVCTADQCDYHSRH